MIETTINGIPCLIRVTHFQRGASVKRHGYADEQDDDELDYDVLDSTGRPAPWLQRKITDADHAEISRLVGESY
jgi:hypothetical protein